MSPEESSPDRSASADVDAPAGPETRADVIGEPVDTETEKQYAERISRAMVSKFDDDPRGDSVPLLNDGPTPALEAVYDRVDVLEYIIERFVRKALCVECDTQIIFASGQGIIDCPECGEEHFAGAI